jgi:hypothetical protein
MPLIDRASTHIEARFTPARRQVVDRAPGVGTRRPFS